MEISPFWSPLLVGSILLFVVWVLDPVRENRLPDSRRLLIGSPAILIMVWVVGFAAIQFFLFLWMIHYRMKSDFVDWVIESVRILF